jgi:hypothetical protein
MKYRDPSLGSYLDNSLPEMDPIISCEETAYGWRGLSLEGEVLEVKSTNGHKANIPSEIIVAYEGKPIGKRSVKRGRSVDIDQYLRHFNRVVECYKSGQLPEALRQSGITMAHAPTLRAKFNQSMILLAMGRWRQGLQLYWECEQKKPFMRPQVAEAISAGLRPWRGEPLAGKRLLLLHAHGFGDTIQMLRYVPRLKRTLMVMPEEMRRLAEQCGLVMDQTVDCDYFCPILHLLYFLNIVPTRVQGGMYLRATNNKSDVARWRQQLGPKKKNRHRIGIAWSVGKPSPGDYPREIDLLELVLALRDKGELHSVQVQGGDVAQKFGVHVHEFKDFADCAAMMSFMDEIISVDTAALHLAGATGHPKVTGLLSHWCSWRWVAPWYNNLRVVKQKAPDDWQSALSQL